ncbi:unnamed protein product [Blepharisma stoltei]|uniref:Uncharacterized protein n=1 Tax=Blepharisma stoltei TaxID=1481888 RepID=A0AAU9IHX6_9CILI|nr:unnamed protein product [Blepharisma stoltei]
MKLPFKLFSQWQGHLQNFQCLSLDSHFSQTPVICLCSYLSKNALLSIFHMSLKLSSVKKEKRILHPFMMVVTLDAASLTWKKNHYLHCLIKRLKKLI